MVVWAWPKNITCLISKCVTLWTRLWEDSGNLEAWKKSHYTPIMTECHPLLCSRYHFVSSSCMYLHTYISLILSILLWTDDFKFRGRNFLKVGRLWQPVPNFTFLFYFKSVNLRNCPRGKDFDFRWPSTWEMWDLFFKHILVVLFGTNVQAKAVCESGL